MATDASTVEYIVDQARLGGAALTSRKMFGEYAIYLDRKVVGLVCDNRLFVKPTDPGRESLGAAPTMPPEAPPYPGAKSHWVMDAWLDDHAALGAVLRATADALPVPKPRAAKKR